MTLVELCEPLFKKICLLNRLGRKGASASAAVENEKLRLEIKQLFADLEKRASAEPGLAAQCRKIELPLIFFVGSMIAECGLIGSPKWHSNRLAYERQQMRGGAKSFQLPDVTFNGLA